MQGILLNVRKRYQGLFILAFVGGAIYGAYMLYRYIKVETDLKRRSAVTIHAEVDNQSVEEFGYIYSKRDELFLKDDNTENLVWFIDVPQTGARYSCSFEEGFSKFKVGDNVRLIRPKDTDDEAGYGYVVGLYYKETGKAAAVWVIDEANLDITIGDSPPD